MVVGVGEVVVLCRSPSRDILLPLMGLTCPLGAAFSGSGRELDMERTSTSNPVAMWEFDSQVLGLNWRFWDWEYETGGSELGTAQDCECRELW